MKMTAILFLVNSQTLMRMSLTAGVVTVCVMMEHFDNGILNLPMWLIGRGEFEAVREYSIYVSGTICGPWVGK